MTLRTKQLLTAVLAYVVFVAAIVFVGWLIWVT
jgi:hypothetical protein